jgi:class 3 adenylate cyclase
MAHEESPGFPAAPRLGLAAKLFVTLLGLGAVAVLGTAALGYFSARDALERAILDQLTNVRQSKVRQIETYFRTIRADLRLLAASKMAAEATREFAQAVAELDKAEAAPDLRQKVIDWYEEDLIPRVSLFLGTKPPLSDYLPVGNAAPFYLQFHYIVTNPNPRERRRLLNDPEDGSPYSKLHAVYHPLLRTAAETIGFADLLIADPVSGRLIYSVDKEVDFATSFRRGPYRRTNVATAVARCISLADPSVVCVEDFASYPPSGGAATAFMAAPIVERGSVTGVLVAQLSNAAIDNIVTGDRRWRQSGLGETGEAYIVGPDFRVRSVPRNFYQDRSRYFDELRDVATPTAEIAAIERYRSPVMHQRIDTEATRAALSGVEATGEIVGYRGKPILASWGPLAIADVHWALVAKIDLAEAFEPIARLRRELIIAGALTLLAVALLAAFLANTLLAPVRELIGGVRKFAAGDYGTHVAVRSRDEIGQLCAAFNGMVGDLRTKNEVISAKNAEIEGLLLNILPAPIANRLRGGEEPIADGFAEVTVAFADLVGFTELSSQMPPQKLVAMLDGLFTRFDAAARDLGIEKIKTVGDAYMAVCGLPTPVPDHAERMVRMAIRMVHIAQEHAMEHGVALKLRVGINSGPVVAGVIGKSKYIYDLWGDTVNLASRMESGALPNSVQVTRSVYERLKDRFVFEPRGEIEVKGKGRVETWMLRL